MKIHKGGINYKDIPTSERVAQLKALKKAIEYKLDKEGWNPLTNTYTQIIIEEKSVFQKLKEMTFVEALDFAVEKKIC